MPGYCRLVLASLLFVSPAAAQTASLVRDIFISGYGSSGGTSGFHSFHGVQGKAFFITGDGSSGSELWVSDGTGIGTEILADICPGQCSPQEVILGSVGGTLVFAANNDQAFQLWRSDGTRAGTFSLASPELVLAAPEPQAWAVSGQQIFFIGCVGHACDLWRTDGTREGTRLVKDLPRNPTRLTAAGDRVFFLLADGTPGSVLWVTDGSEAGTMELGQPGDGFLRSPVAAGGRLFFLSNTPETGKELWTSDGTVQGTRRLTEFPDEQPFALQNAYSEPFLWPAGKRVYFVADDSVHGYELWRSDGTPAGTRRVTDFDLLQPFTISERLLVEEVKDRAVFVATNGLTLPKLWTSDGKPESMTQLPDPCAGACELLPEDPRLVRAGDRVFYAANDGLHGLEVWATDGTPRGTRMLRDVCPGPCDSFSVFEDLRAFGASVLFTATPAATGPELFLSDGTSEGTKQITDFGEQGHVSGYPLEATLTGSKAYFVATDAHGGGLWMSEGGGPSRLVADVTREVVSSDPLWLVEHGGQLFFSAFNGFSGQEIWHSDGTAGGTAAVTDYEGFWQPHRLTSAGDWLFFEDDRTGLWRTDGTAAGTVHLLQDASIGEIASFQERAVFSYNPASPDRWELWRSDGTPAGTGKALALPGGHYLSQLTVLGNHLYFLTEDSPTQKLWRWDGTSATATPLAEISISGGDDLQLTRAGSRVLFVASSRLWTTDGSPQGTYQVSGPDGPYVTAVAAIGSHLYFLGHHSGYGLWRTDGTLEGTVLVRELPTDGPDVYFGSQLVALGGRLYFQASDPAHGIELWTSDGTADGTALLRDVFPGPESGAPQELTPAGDRIFFSAGEPVHGLELWQTDGTPAGTRLVQDIAPQGSSSTPSRMTVAGGRLFFSADDGVAGRELWMLPLAGSTGCQPSPTRLCLNNGRFRVEAFWRDFQGNVGYGQAVALTADTGYFWFFDPSNVETIVKVLDGQGLNGHHWVFYGALSTVDYTLTVTDTQTGLTRRYHNPAGRLASVGDTIGFGPLGAFSRTPAAASPPVLAAERSDLGAAGAPCQATDERLCLENGRFAVEVSWKDFQGKAGKGKAVPLTAETGYFWFFDSANVEVVLKVLDGTPLNGKHWVFYGALSSVEYKVTVTDTQTGKVKVYENPSGRLASVADTSAFEE